MPDLELVISESIPVRDVGIAAEETGAETEDRLENLEPLSAILVMGALGVMAKFLVRLAREINGGTVIDLRERPVSIDRDRDLPYGFFVIVAEDGTATVEAKDEPTDALERMTKGLLSLPLEASTELAKETIRRLRTRETTEVT